MVYRVLIAASVTVTLLVPFAHTQGKTDPSLDKLAVEFEAAFKAKDAAKVAAFYAEDAVMMPPNEPSVKGRTAIQAHYANQFKQGFTNLDLNPTESAVSGQQAFDVGTSSIVLPDGRTENGKYLVVYKRVGADWKLAYDIFNSDSPSPK
jgi:uncharacterized protein (TIGR02246 family)